MYKLKISVLAATALLLASCGGQRSTSSSTEIQASSETAVTETTSGKVAGYTLNGLNIFKGIPYAKAGRFEAPQPADKWEGVRSCRSFGPTSPQGKRAGWQNDEIAFAFDWDDGYTGEDCQRLNIWTQGLADGKKRPVMVWLHGGGFAAGSGQELPGYDGANLAKEGAVVVTLNHRLNALGFLDLSDFGEKYAKSGNAGLLDIVAALQWVKDNIANFGGDPDNVTIFGQSGGGGKVSTLLNTPSAKGLFHKAIVQSGSMLRMMPGEVSRQIGRETVKELGLNASDIGAIDTIPYEQLLAAGERAIAKVKAEQGDHAAFIFGWAPTVDGDVLAEHPFDGKAPELSKDIPMIIGTTLHEFTASTYVPAMKEMTEAQIVEALRQKYGEDTDEFVTEFKKVYPDYTPIDLIDTDFTFRPGAVEQARLKAEQEGGAPVYMYLFAWESPIMEGRLRSTHCMEIPFVFNNTDLHASMTGGGDEARALGKKMSEAWLNFARTGNPNGAGVPEWPAYTAADGATMVFDNDCKVVNNHDAALLEVVRRSPVRGF